MTTSLSKLNKKIISCTRCTRLVEFRGKIAVEKRKQYINEEYWGKPITGYGDPAAIERGEFLQGINHPIFSLNAYLLRDYPINRVQFTEMMA